MAEYSLPDSEIGAPVSEWTSTEPSFWQALAVEDDGESIVYQRNPPSSLPFEMGVNIHFSPVTDPGVDDNHRIVVRWLWRNIESPSPSVEGLQCNARLVFSDGVGGPFSIFRDIDIYDNFLPDIYRTTTFDLTEAEVQNFRAANCYTNGFYFTCQGAAWDQSFPPETGEIVFEIDYLALEVGEAGPTPPTPPEPDIEITGSGGIEVGGGIAGSNDLIVSVDASGIYTIVPGQRFDRIYNRNTDTDQTHDVAIPNPYLKTGYYGG